MKAEPRLSLESPITGVAVPLSSLRSEKSCGIGEFLDLPPFAEWCAESGLSLVQILPVNDTGTQVSPYSAVSAFALHPVYASLEDVPGTEPLASEIAAFRTSAEANRRLDLEHVFGFKLDILHRTYRETLNPSIDQALDDWITDNEWVRPYAVYKCLKDRYEQRSWVDWPDHRDVAFHEIDELWDELRDFVRFYAWIQMHLDRQFREAVDKIRQFGVHLKGDIPILMNVDSADVWAHRSFFNLDFGAGAPPDMFTRTGQTWGFPIYRWDELEKDRYEWWKSRLKVAAKYYDAFRIDHVIGFFRIWSQPSHERTATLGHYEPSASVTLGMMQDEGLTADEILLLTNAWTTLEEALAALGDEAERVLEVYFQPEAPVSESVPVSDQTLDPTYILDESFGAERLIDDLDEPEAVRNFLLQCHRNRTFIPDGEGAYYPAWYWDESKGLARLDAVSSERLNRLINSYKQHSKPIWMALGRKNLKIVSRATNMLACAEDLGAVPEGLRDVLNELGILSLKIERWEIDKNGTFIHPSKFPRLSVSTPSVHDLATLRVWWEESEEHIAYFDQLELDGDCPSYLTVEVAEAVIKRNLESSSAIVVFQIQDLFALTYDLRIDPPVAERINVPGTVGDHNWTYRIPVTIEALCGHRLGERVKALVSNHRSRAEKKAIH